MGDVEKVKQIHRFLAAQKLPDSDFRQLVQKHAESLCHSLREKPLSWEDVANIAEHLKDGPWSEAQHTMLSQAMSEGADRGEQRTTRRPNQTCRDFSPYWSVGDLDILKGNKPLAEKLDTIASRMVAWFHVSRFLQDCIMKRLNVLGHDPFPKFVALQLGFKTVCCPPLFIHIWEPLAAEAGILHKETLLLKQGLLD